MHAHPIRHWLRLIEASMTAFDDYIDPEDVIDYEGLAAFARRFIDNPPHRTFSDMRDILGGRDEPSAKPLPYTLPDAQIARDAHSPASQQIHLNAILKNQ